MSHLDWHVGMKVVCIDPTWGSTGAVQKVHCPNLPKAGAVYTIRSIESRVVVRGYDPQTLIRLMEVRNPDQPNGEAVFFASKFRPVQTRKTDISIFTAMLTNSKQGVSA